MSRTTLGDGRCNNQLQHGLTRARVAGPDLVSQKGVPTSMESAVVQSLLASVSVMKAGCGRFRIDVDTTGGDETYTTLKNSVPFTRVFAKGLMANGFSQVRLIFPDVGAAALATRDWAGEDGHVVSSFGRSAPEIEASDDVVVCLAPASSEIEQLRKLSEQAAELGLPLILINPSVKSPGGENLGSLGAYAINLRCTRLCCRRSLNSSWTPSPKPVSPLSSVSSTALFCLHRLHSDMICKR